jgi:ribonuclease D
MQVNYQFIDTLTGLEDFAKSLEEVRSVAVDLEADSMYHFQEKVCLLQMASGTASVVIDPIQIKDMSSLKPLFFNRKIKKVFHGADYDVRSLYRDFDIQINNLFDTQAASMFLGYKETGLNAVLKKKFGISLNKKYQKKDWSVRPLPEK